MITPVNLGASGGRLHRHPALSLAVAATLLACLLSAILAPASTADARVAPSKAGTVAVSIDESAPGAPVPMNFLGLSYEVKYLPQVASFAQTGDLVSLLRSLGTGVLRFGGVTADTQVAWLDP